ncbi:MAG: hypothetical protein F6K40_18945 [Okeania sp. SIO3I5]|uniref:hypothetical protein n=1 Tax=Okeania sp. SIO3I5 TaxID=2607805 RepID=UPI0013B97A48|nr:hypothetical protein [Okeania sp. SIO3I5]NEQ38225.1 hypothetical protein [Okeania sp. SIO3I5]
MKPNLSVGSIQNIILVKVNFGRSWVSLPQPNLQIFGILGVGMRSLDIKRKAD